MTHPPIYISSPIAALVEGIYKADTTLAHIKSKGNFGIGTFNDLDGELVLIDNKAYCLRPEGKASIMADEILTPFAIATFFSGDTEDTFDNPIDAQSFEENILNLIPSRNLMYAICIDGLFSYVCARSVPKQKNYVPLADIIKHQTLFEFSNVRGSIIGFYTPSFLDSVHVPGLHLHFITEDRQSGGHVFRFGSLNVSIKLQHSTSIELGLPMTLDFLTMERTRNLQADLAAAEK